MISAYSLISLAGYILFYLGTFLALTAVFGKHGSLKKNLSQNRISTIRLGIGLLIFVVGGIFQVMAESFWGYLFCF